MAEEEKGLEMGYRPGELLSQQDETELLLKRGRANLCHHLMILGKSAKQMLVNKHGPIRFSTLMGLVSISHKEIVKYQQSLPAGQTLKRLVRDASYGGPTPEKFNEDKFRTEVVVARVQFNEVVDKVFHEILRALQNGTLAALGEGNNDMNILNDQYAAELTKVLYYLKTNKEGESVKIPHHKEQDFFSRNPQYTKYAYRWEGGAISTIIETVYKLMEYWERFNKQDGLLDIILRNETFRTVLEQNMPQQVFQDFSSVFGNASQIPHKQFPLNIPKPLPEGVNEDSIPLVNRVVFSGWWQWICAIRQGEVREAHYYVVNPEPPYNPEQKHLMRFADYNPPEKTLHEHTQTYAKSNGRYRAMVRAQTFQQSSVFYDTNQEYGIDHNMRVERRVDVNMNNLVAARTGVAVGVANFNTLT